MTPFPVLCTHSEMLRPDTTRTMEKLEGGRSPSGLRPVPPASIVVLLLPLLKSCAPVLQEGFHNPHPWRACTLGGEWGDMSPHHSWDVNLSL